jgi:hypothetical protein
VIALRQSVAFPSRQAYRASSNLIVRVLRASAYRASSNLIVRVLRASHYTPGEEISLLDEGVDLTILWYKVSSIELFVNPGI